MLYYVHYQKKSTPKFNASKARTDVDTLAITYERSSQVKRNKLSLLTHKHEFFTVEEGEDIQYMIGCFQTILNEFMSLGITFDNYDHIDKILRSLSRNCRPQVTTLRA